MGHNGRRLKEADRVMLRPSSASAVPLCPSPPSMIPNQVGGGWEDGGSTCASPVLRAGGERARPQSAPAHTATRMNWRPNEATLTRGSYNKVVSRQRHDCPFGGAWWRWRQAEMGPSWVPPALAARLMAEALTVKS